MKIKVPVVISLISGIIFTVLFYFLSDFSGDPNSFAFAVCAGTLYTMAMFTFMLLSNRSLEKRLFNIEKGLGSPVFYRTSGNFDLGQGKAKFAFLFFCENGIAIVLNTKPYPVQKIALENISDCKFDVVHMNIYTKDGKTFMVTIPDAEKVSEALKERGWI